MIRAQNLSAKRAPFNAGIAIGPILFIIAILAILAAAIAAGSGSFTASTASEGNKTKAGGLIQIGENLKVGMDRIVMENGLGWQQWNINATTAPQHNDLFSPTGGGILGALDGTGGRSRHRRGTIRRRHSRAWHHGRRTAGGDQRQRRRVQRNQQPRLYGVSESPSGTLGDFTSGDINSSSFSGWPTNLKGKTLGCVSNVSNSGNFYFYQVLYIQ